MPGLHYITKRALITNPLKTLLPYLQTKVFVSYKKTNLFLIKN